MDKVTQLQRVADLLAELGFDVQREGRRGLTIMFEGVYATVVVYDDGTLSMMCSVGGEGIDLRLQEINEANNRVRFAKFSVEHKNLLLEADFVFALAAPDAQEQLRTLVQLWRMALRELKDLVGKLVSA